MRPGEGARRNGGERDVPRFAPSMVEALPAPARRWLTHAIAPGTPLARTAQLSMRGSIRLRRGARPFAMRATQTITPGRGFVWRASVHRGVLRIQGFDRYAEGHGSMRWTLWGAIPVAVARGAGVDRSAAGRLAGESILVPSALIGAEWASVDERRATARVAVDGSSEPVDVTVDVDAEGRLWGATVRRWNADAANGPLGYLPFGIDRIEESTFAGYTIASRFRAGWRLGEPDEFPFFEATVEEASFR